MLNKELVLKVADAIERETIPNLGFDMKSWCENENSTWENPVPENLCGTTACIAGWVCAIEKGGVKVLLENNTKTPEEGSFSYFITAADLLGLEPNAASELFYETGGTREEAIACLRNLAKTGKVEWDERFHSKEVAP